MSGYILTQNLPLKVLPISGGSCILLGSEAKLLSSFGILWHLNQYVNEYIRRVAFLTLLFEFNAFKVPQDSPLRKTHSLFWGIRSNDEGVGRPNGFHSLVRSGDIQLVAPARVVSYGTDGRSVVLQDGRVLEADLVVLCTGFTSSWKPIFDGEYCVVPDFDKMNRLSIFFKNVDSTLVDLGLDKHTIPNVSKYDQEWNYTTLANPPPSPHRPIDQMISYIYRGIVPAKNIERRDFVIAGSIVSDHHHPVRLYLI